MIIRTTTDPISLHEVTDPLNHPCVYDSDNGLEIYFENEENRKAYLDMEMNNRIVLQSNNTDDYVAER